MGHIIRQELEKKYVEIAIVNLLILINRLLAMSGLARARAGRLACRSNDADQVKHLRFDPNNFIGEAQRVSLKLKFAYDARVGSLTKLAALL